MTEDLRDKITGGLRKFEELTLKIPGYGGYRQKELRRDADKMLRMRLARSYEEQMRRLGGLQLELTNRGELSAVMALERVSLKLQLLIDRMKTASYGYSGFFDAVKIKEEQLDALYEFDSGLAEGADRISDLLDRLTEKLHEEEGVFQETADLVALLEELNTTWSHRQDVVLEIEQ